MLYQSEQNHIVIDVTKAPYFADNTGKTDCTEVLCRALDDVLRREIDGVNAMREKLLKDPRDNFRIGFENRKMGGIPTVIFPEDPPAARIIYLPAGTYLISDTITYSFENLKNLLNDRPGSDLNRFIRFKGDGADKTIIKLKDNCHAFRYGENKPMVSFVRSNGSNVAMMNSFEDIALDSGVGNSGAIGLRFHANNTGKIKNVSIRTSDSEYRGYAGMQFDLGQSCIAENIVIDGFEYGVHVTCSSVIQAFDNITITNSQRRAFHVNAGCISVNNFRVTTNGMVAYMQASAMANFLSGTCKRLGAKGGTAFRTYDGLCYLRHVTTENFGETFVDGYETTIKENGTVDEYNSCKRVYKLFGCEKNSLDMTPPPTPIYEWNGDRSIVAEVEDFGAKGDGVTDSTVAIQAAMNSGKEYIVFGEGRYLVSGEIKVPATVRAINFEYCDFAVSEDFAEEKTKGLFAIEEASKNPLHMEDAFVFEKFYGYIRFIRHSAKRDLVVEDVHVQTGAFYFNTVGGSTVWMDNVASTMGVFGGIGYGATPCFHFRDGQTAWLRQFNPERSAINCLVENKSSIWVLGFKTEGPDGKGFDIRGGSKAEILGGASTIATDNGIPCIENHESSVFAFMRTDGCGPNHQFTVAAIETQKGITKLFNATDMPKFSVEYYSIPGYVGIHE